MEHYTKCIFFSLNIQIFYEISLRSQCRILVGRRARGGISDLITNFFKYQPMVKAGHIITSPHPSIVEMSKQSKLVLTDFYYCAELEFLLS